MPAEGGGVASPVEAVEGHHGGEMVAERESKESVGGIGGAVLEGHHLQGAATTGEEVGAGGAVATV